MKAILFGLLAAGALVACTASTSDSTAQGGQASTSGPAETVVPRVLMLLEDQSGRDPEEAANEAIADGNSCLARAHDELTALAADPDVQRTATDASARAGATEVDLEYWLDTTYHFGWIASSETLDASVMVDLLKGGNERVTAQQQSLGSAPWNDLDPLVMSTNPLWQSGACDVTKQQILDLLNAI